MLITEYKYLRRTYSLISCESMSCPIKGGMRLTTSCENYATTLTESTFEFSITGEEIRGGQGNALYGKYFHDSSLNVTLTDAMFNLQYMAASLGVNLEMGGLTVAEEELVVGAGGSMIGWYRKPTDADWTIGTITGNTTMSIPGSAQNEHYCVKYFWQNPNAESITIPVQYVPATLHVVILNDLFSGDVADIGNATRYGRLVTDIPRLQMDGNQTLSLTSSGAATVSLTGSALAVTNANTCEDAPIYGTMTQEIYGAKWQDSVGYLAIANSEIELAQEGTETLEVWAVFTNGASSRRIDNSACTFVVEDSPASTATGTQVGANTGVITASTTPGVAVIGVTLTDYANVPPAYATVTVT